MYHDLVQAESIIDDLKRVQVCLQNARMTLRAVIDPDIELEVIEDVINRLDRMSVEAARIERVIAAKAALGEEAEVPD
jgi:hypothetical protein